MANKIINAVHNKLPWRNLGEFSNPNGIFKDGIDGYHTFVPQKLPPSFTYDHEMIILLACAERKVGELKGRGADLENPHILIRAYLKKEAVLSSKIEGTLASLEDLNFDEAVGSMDKNNAENMRLKEVINYVIALEASLEKIRKSKQIVSLDMLKDAHQTLMTGVRGGDRRPGKIRDMQNWIIKSQGIKQEIVYTPPPPEMLADLLCDLESFFQKDNSNIPTLIQCAIIHYQFEAIHPFADGNGRIGRLLLPLILCQRKLMPEPLLYLSAYFDTHLDAYYGGLLAVSQKSQWSDWIKFFLKAFIEQSDETTRSIQRLSALVKKYKKILLDKNASVNSIVLMEHMFSNPYITIPHASKFLNVAYPAAKNAVMTLVDMNILKQTNIPHRSKVFVADEIEKTLNVD